MLLDVRPDHLQIVRDILQKHVPQHAVWAFGSRAKWTAKDYSDLDLCIVSDHPLGFSVLGTLADEFSESDLPYKVDIVDWATVSESFRKIIERDKVVVQKGSGSKSTASPAPTLFSSDEIQWKPFTDLLLAIIDNRGRTCPVGDSGIPLIATNCIDSGSLFPRYETTRYVSAETYKTWFRGHPIPGDILFVCKGSPGRTNWTPDPVDFCIAQDMVAVRADPKKIYPKYLFAALRSSIVLSQIDNMHVGTMIPHFKKGDFGKLSIPVPDKKSQHEIGDFYFSVSERIDLIRKTNATLEAIAQALFKSWFVDFEPVRAKAEGREPEGVPPEVVELFPSEFEDSELGKIPKGWTVTSLDSIAKYLNGLALQKYPATDDADWLPAIKIAQLRKGSTEGADKVSCSIPKEYVIEDGDVIFSWSGSLEVAIWCGGKGALNQHLFKVSSSKYPKWFYYLWTVKHLPAFREVAASKATTMGHIQRHHLAEAKVLVPDDELIERMSEVISPILERASVALLEARSLALVRDELLPRFLSGRLYLSEGLSA